MEIWHKMPNLVDQKFAWITEKLDNKLLLLARSLTQFLPSHYFHIQKCPNFQLIFSYEHIYPGTACFCSESA